jgi:oligoribonuclease NrnB/cAMP/cGMP phosphodiesterase (DHH superfamily)
VGIVRCMKKFCFYHAGCPDGFGAVWSVWQAWGDSGTYIPRTHDELLPMERLEGALVVFVDISVDNRQLRELSDVAGQILLLDHHITALNRYQSDTSLVNRIEDAGHEVVFDLTHSGAVLAWNYFHPDEPTPDLLQYVEDQDLWNWKLEGSDAVNAAIASYPRTFESWNDLSERGHERLIAEGEPIVRANRIEVDRSLKNASTVCIGNDRVEAVNASVNRSATGHELAKRAAYGRSWGCVYRLNGKQIHATLYSIGDQDVSEIATSLGGGGHRNAAGFTVSLERWLKDFC